MGGPLCMLSDVEIRYEWFVQNPDNSFTEIAEYLEENGNITVVSGNVDPNTHELIVSPEENTVYRLVRTPVVNCKHFAIALLGALVLIA